MVQTWPAARNPCTTQFSEDKQRLHRGRNQHVGDEQREVVDVVVIGLPRGHGIRGCRGFKADRKEDDLPVGILLGEFQRIERRVDDANVGAFGLGVEQALGRTRHAQHVAEGTEDHFRALRNRHGLVDQINRRHADRAAGSVDQSDVARQQVFETALDDGVSLAAADFHDGPGARYFLPDCWASCSAAF